MGRWLRLLTSLSLSRRFTITSSNSGALLISVSQLPRSPINSTLPTQPHFKSSFPWLMSLHSEVAVAATSSGDIALTAQERPLWFCLLPSRRMESHCQFFKIAFGMETPWSQSSLKTMNVNCLALKESVTLQDPPRTHTQWLTASRESHTGRVERRQETALTMRTWLESSCFSLIPPPGWAFSSTCQSYACDTQPKLFCVPCLCWVPRASRASSLFLQSQDPVESPLSRRSRILSGGAGGWFNFSLALSRGRGRHSEATSLLYLLGQWPGSRSLETCSWSNNWNDYFDRKVPQNRELGFEALDRWSVEATISLKPLLWLAQAHLWAVAGFQLLSASPLLLNPGLTRWAPLGEVDGYPLSEQSDSSQKDWF